MPQQKNIAIIGGGPAGSTCAALLKKYNPDLSTLILEKATFPREHVGESQLPAIGAILNEMGVWDKIEAADFPIKLGATYRWGSSADLWDFSFLQSDEFAEQPRPGIYEGQRRLTAFHVERSRYDQILLDHAADLGCQVRQGTQVRQILRNADNPDHIDGLKLDDGSTITADWYVDATGCAGTLRRAMDVDIDSPAKLKNVAAWGYWDNAKWPVRVGEHATRVMILSIDCGWLWYIPLSDTRVSIGFVCPASYYKSRGLSFTDLYQWAVQQEPLITQLTQDAKLDGDVIATKDWSFIADRFCGDNWFLAGESAGFADPILAAGLTLTHSGAREVAYALLEMYRDDHDPQWLKSRYEEVLRRRIEQHIRFADFWYAGNGQFTDLEEETSRIAKEAGLKLDPKAAFRWLSNGGFSNDTILSAGLAGIDLNMVKRATNKLTGATDAGWLITKFNVFHLNLRGSREEQLPHLHNGHIIKQDCLIREDKVLPIAGIYSLVLDGLSRHSAAQDLVDWMGRALAQSGIPEDRVSEQLYRAFQVLEVLLVDGWVWGQRNTKKPTLQFGMEVNRTGSMITDAGSPASTT